MYINSIQLKILLSHHDVGHICKACITFGYNMIITIIANVDNVEQCVGLTVSPDNVSDVIKF